MSLIILYHDPKRLGEAGTNMIAGQAKAGAVINQLEKRGFIIDKITFAPLSQPRRQEWIAHHQGRS